MALESYLSQVKNYVSELKVNAIKNDLDAEKNNLSNAEFLQKNMIFGIIILHKAESKKLVSFRKNILNIWIYIARYSK